MSKKLAIITTHPIQYNAPLFRQMTADGLDIKVFYTWSQAIDIVADKEFGRDIKWDIPLLDGYEYEVVENISIKPKQEFGGLVNPDLIPAIERWGAEAVLFFGWNFKSHLKAMRHFHGRIPVFFRGDSTLLDERPGLKTFLRRTLLRWVYSHVDVAFYVGTNNRAYFQAHGLRDNQLVLAPHAVENSRFGTPEAVTEGLRWRKELGYTSDDKVLVYAGKISKRKNIVEFASQFIYFADQHPDTSLRLLVIGDGPDEAQLPSHPLIARLPFQNQSKMPAVYTLADCVVLPSKSGETWGLVINEAMASGRAVVASSKVGCAVDLVDEGLTGFYYNLNSIDNNTLFDTLETADLLAIGLHNQSYIRAWNFCNISNAIASKLLCF